MCECVWESEPPREVDNLNEERHKLGENECVGRGGGGVGGDLCRVRERVRGVHIRERVNKYMLMNHSVSQSISQSVSETESIRTSN